MSTEETESRTITKIIPSFRIARGLMLLLAALACYLAYIWYKAQAFWWDDGTFGFYAYAVIFPSFVFGSYELYYGVKFIRIPTSDILSFESNSILVLSLISEIMFVGFFLSSLHQLILVLTLIHLSLYMSLFLLEVRILYSNYSSRAKRVPTFNDSYIPERFR